MSLQIIGAGFGRTGTLSMKLALEQLGLDPCYHMREVLQHPEHDPMWLAATRGEAVDWDAVFGAYQATVDWPAAAFWRELMVAYPDARVLLTVRNSEDWYRSVSSTIYRALTSAPDPARPGSVEHRQMTRALILERTFGGRFEDKAHAIGVFEAHNQAVRKTVPSDKLLVYETGSGWGPLCGFLGVDTPSTPYPRVNTTADFQKRRTWNPDEPSGAEASEGSAGGAAAG